MGDLLEPLGQWSAQAESWGVPALLGEFGIAHDLEGAADYATLNFDALDALLMHGTLWEYSTTVDDWNHEGMSIVGSEGGERATAAAVVRAYPATVAGTIVS